MNPKIGDAQLEVSINERDEAPVVLTGFKEYAIGQGTSDVPSLPLTITFRPRISIWQGEETLTVDIPLEVCYLVDRIDGLTGERGPCISNSDIYDGDVLVVGRHRLRVASVDYQNSGSQLESLGGLTA
jgi:hypothetical protein